MSEPTLGSGKICYVELPATDVARSAAFYRDVFGWRVRTRGDGATAFDDGVGQVSGAWVTGRPPHTVEGLRLYIMVASARDAAAAVVAAGGSLVTPVDPAAREVFFTFRDPGGNVMGVYQDPSLSARGG
jgi:predicted enzyme related to lactoylglutathione lyase